MNKLIGIVVTFFSVLLVWVVIRFIYLPIEYEARANDIVNVGEWRVGYENYGYGKSSRLYRATGGNSWGDSILTNGLPDHYGLHNGQTVKFHRIPPNTFFYGCRAVTECLEIEK